MTFFVAIVVLSVGILIGYWLRDIVASLRTKYQQAVYKPTAVKALSFDVEAGITKDE